MAAQLPDTKPIFVDAEKKMHSAIESLGHHFESLRTGRASAALLDNVRVDNYGTPAPVNQVATISTPDSRSLTISPWNKSQLGVIEKAILAANIGLTPQNDGKIIRLIIPPLTEERRKEIAKKAHGMAEDSRIAIRNVRKHGKESLEKMKKVLGEDLLHDAVDQLQKLTDKHIAQVDELLKKKEAEIMQV